MVELHVFGTEMLSGRDRESGDRESGLFFNASQLTRENVAIILISFYSTL